MVNMCDDAKVADIIHEYKNLSFNYSLFYLPQRYSNFNYKNSLPKSFTDKHILNFRRTSSTFSFYESYLLLDGKLTNQQADNFPSIFQTILSQSAVLLYLYEKLIFDHHSNE